MKTTMKWNKTRIYFYVAWKNFNGFSMKQTSYIELSTIFTCNCVQIYWIIPHCSYRYEFAGINAPTWAKSCTRHSLCVLIVLLVVLIAFKTSVAWVLYEQIVYSMCLSQIFHSFWHFNCFWLHNCPQLREAATTAAAAAATFCSF